MMVQGVSSGHLECCIDDSFRISLLFLRLGTPYALSRAL